MKRALLLDAMRDECAPFIDSGGAALSGAASSGSDRLIAGAASFVVKGERLNRLRKFDIALLALAAEGLNDKEIAREISWQAPAVHQRWRMVREILGAKDRAHAVAIGLSLQLIGPPQRALEMLAEN